MSEIEEIEFSELVEKFIEQKDLTFNGPGTNDLMTLVTAIDDEYETIDDFFADNPGAQEAVAEWIRNANVEQWKTSLAQKVDHA